MSPRTARRALGLVALAALGACAEEAVDRPRLSVYRYRYEAGCYDACQQDAVVDEDLATAPASLCDPPPETCEFRPGRDRARVIVDYAGLSFQDAIPDITITTLVDGEAFGSPVSVDGQHDQEDGAFAVREFQVPLAPRGELRFSVEVSGSFDATSEPARLADPSFAARFLRCGGLEACELPAGAGKAAVVLDVPRGLAEVELVSTIDGILQGGAQVVPVSGNPGEDIVVEVDIPDRADTTWALSPRAGLFGERTPAVASLVPRPPLELGAVAGPADIATMVDGQFPRRIALEPDPECRRVQVVVRNTQAVGGQRVTLTTSEGSLDSRGQTVELVFDEDGLAAAELDLGAALVTGGEVRLEAVSPELGRVAQRWTLLALLPETAELFMPGSPQSLDASGTPALTVSGLLRPPAALSAPSLPAGFVTPRFSPGTTANVVVAASTSGTPLECGTPLPAENIDCDRSGTPGVPQGGCAWTPTAISVSPDGGFQLQLPAGQCFGGDVTFSVVSPGYAGAFDVGTCVGEQIPEPAGPAAAISAIETLTYID